MSNEITAAETVTETTPNKSDAAVEQVIESALDLGKLWARHGLTLGRLALETSAISLGTTAKMLASIAEAIAPEEKKADEAA